MSDDTSFNPPFEVAFAFNDFATVTGTVVSGHADTLTVEFAPAVWETVDLLQLFHLGWGERGEGTVSGTAPVQIELRLAAEVATRAGVADGPEALADSLAAAAETSPLRQHDSWYALTVTEAVDLPPDLADLGEVRAGFTTVWAESVE